MDENIPEKIFLETRNGKAVLQHLNTSSTKQPVLFIHGFNSSEKIWFSHKKSGVFYEGFAEKALQDGYDVWLLGLSKSRSANLVELAEDDLLLALQTIYAKTNQKIKIIAHSMSGVLCRYLSHPIYFESLESDVMESLVFEVVTLSTPHYGFSVRQKFKNKITGFFEHFEIWASKKKERPLYGYFQYFSQSEFFVTINNNAYFNPEIKWINAVADHDFFVHKSSILPENTGSNVHQKFFNVNHFEIPFSSYIIHLLNKLSIKSKKMDFVTSPPIYWSKDVYEWIFKVTN